MSKILTYPVGVYHNTYEAYDHSRSQNNIVPSIFHIVLIPLGLSIGSVPAALVYFALAIGAYFTIFRDKNHYVIAILKFVGAIALVVILWFGLILAIGMIGAAL